MGWVAWGWLPFWGIWLCVKWTAWGWSPFWKAGADVAWGQCLLSQPPCSAAASRTWARILGPQLNHRLAASQGTQLGPGFPGPLQ